MGAFNLYVVEDIKERLAPETPMLAESDTGKKQIIILYEYNGKNRRWRLHEDHELFDVLMAAETNSANVRT